MTELLVGVAIGVVVAYLGVFAGVGWTITQYAKEERKRKVRETQPICGCKHHYSFHKDSGECQATLRDGYNTYRCGCQRYVGSMPELEGRES